MGKVQRSDGRAVIASVGRLWYDPSTAKAECFGSEGGCVVGKAVSLLLLAKVTEVAMGSVS